MKAPPADHGHASRSAVAIVFAVALAVRLYRLDAQLWLDEISAMESIERPPWDILTRWPGASSHVLYEFLASVTLRVVPDQVIAVRLPAALFGAAGVAAFHALASGVLARRTAIFSTALFAVSYHHVFFSQNARGYTVLVFFAILSSHLLLRLRGAEARPRRLWAAYVGSLTACAYSVPIGVFVAAGHCAVVVVCALLRRRRGAAAPVPLQPFVACIALSGAIVALLYAPLVGGISAYASANRASAGEGPRMGLWLLSTLFEGLSAAMMGPVGVAVAAAVGLVGLSVWCRRHAFELSILVAPVVLQTGAMAAAGVGIYPRYFAVALVPLVLVGASAVETTLATAADRILPDVRARRAAVAASLALVAAGSAFPLLRYFRYPKQDFLGALSYVREHRGPTDRVVGVHLAGHVLNRRYHAGIDEADSLDELVAAESASGVVWAITTLEPLLAIEDPALARRVHSEYSLERRFPGTVGDGDLRVYVRRR